MELPIPLTTKDVIGPLPEGWSRATIGEISVVNPRSFEREPDAEDCVSFLPMQAIHEGDGHLDLNEERPWREVNRGYTRFQEGDVIFAKITPCMENGKVSVARGLKGGRAAGTTELHVFRPRTGIHPDFVRYFLLTDKVRRNARARMTGTAGQLRVPAAVMEQMEIPIPPTAEQKRIVEAIETRIGRLGSAQTSLRSALMKLRVFRRTVLESTIGFCFIQTWDTRTVRELCSEIVDCPHSTPKYGEGEHFAVDTTCLEPGRVVTERLRRLSGADFKSRTKRLAPAAGDVVLAREGTVGTAAVLPDKPSVCLGQRVMLLRPLPSLSSKFLQYTLMASGTRSQYTSLLSGSTVSHLNVRDVKNLRLPVPPLSEQTRLVATLEHHLSIADEAMSEIERGLRRCELVRSSLLMRAFEGRLGPQDTNDEPASVLLERLKIADQITSRTARRAQKLLVSK